MLFPDTPLREECDAGAGNSDTTPNACRTTCDLPSCGDGVTDSPEEECDSLSPVTYNDGTGNVQVTYDDVTSVTVAAVSLTPVV